MNVMSLFAGIGGFDLAAEWIGWNTVVQVEIDDWCRKVLAKNFPDAIRHDDIKTFDGTPYRGAVDLVCGGFPCQPYSTAGKRLGKADDRHLWPEMLRVIREVRPQWVVGENVRGLLSWNGGLVFDEVCADLETLGYEVQSFLIPACGVNAPHRRDRLWIVAHANGSGFGTSERNVWSRQSDAEGSAFTNSDQFNGNRAGFRSSTVSQQQAPKVRRIPIADPTGSHDANHSPESDSRQAQQFGVGIEPGFVADTENIGPHRHGHAWRRRDGSSDNDSGASANTTSSRGRQANGAGKSKQPHQNGPKTDWRDFPTQPPLCAGDDGVSRGMDRTRTIKGAGNAVVPKLAYQIFQAIDLTDKHL